MSYINDTFEILNKFLFLKAPDTLFGVNPGGGGRALDFGMGFTTGVVGSPGNIIVSYNVQEYEMRTIYKAVTFQK